MVSGKYFRIILAVVAMFYFTASYYASDPSPLSLSTPCAKLSPVTKRTSGVPKDSTKCLNIASTRSAEGSQPYLAQGDGSLATGPVAQQLSETELS